MLPLAKLGNIGQHWAFMPADNSTLDRVASLINIGQHWAFMPADNSTLDRVASLINIGQHWAFMPAADSYQFRLSFSLSNILGNIGHSCLQLIAISSN